MKRGKKYKEAIAKVDAAKVYGRLEALDLAKEISFAKFDETVEASVCLNIKKSHSIRDTVVLPHQFAGEKKVLVFAKGDKEKEALEAGADYAGSDDLVEKIKEGWLEFDKAVATPDMMGTVGKLGKVLGPRGLMPNAKLGTVTFEVANAVKELKAGKIDFRVEKNGIVHAPMGKVSFGPERLLQNIASFFDVIQRLKPSTSKGAYLRAISISTTMGPGIKIDTGQVRELSASVSV